MLDPRAFARFRKNRGALAGAALVILVTSTSLLGPLFAPHNPDEQFAEGLTAQGLPRDPGDAGYLLGTDGLGRDEFSRLLHGGLVSMQVAFFATGLSLLLGLSVGIAAGYFGGRIDGFCMRAVDVLLSLPFLLIAIAVNRAVSNPSLWSLYVLLGALSWPALARVTRTKVMQVRALDYIAAAQALGAATRRVLLRHVVPNVLGPAIIIGTTMVAEMIVVESAMSFLGLGVQPPQASWGSMLYEGRDALAHSPHLLVAPGVLIAMTVFGFNLLGEGLRDALDPKG
jgi:ABC-type dipeptide/oligopeptide/nickel transport system permease subunit